MAWITDWKIKQKLVATYVLVGLVPLITSAWLCLSSGGNALEKSAFLQLQAVQEIKKNQIKSYFENRIKLMKDARQDLRFTEGIALFMSSYKLGMESAGYRQLVSEREAGLKSFRDMFGFYDLFLIDSDGNVTYTVAKEPDLGTNLITGPWKDTGLARIFNKSKQGVAFEDYSWYTPSNAPASFIAAPLTDSTGKYCGTVAFQISLDEINAIMMERTGMGKTGETYLVGPHKRMCSDSFRDPDGHSVKASFRGTVEKNGVDTEASQKALAGESGISILTSYNGSRVLSAYSPLELPGTRWAVIAEIDLGEVRSPIYVLTSSTVIIVLITALAVVLLAFLISNNIANPIIKITNIAQEISKGNLNEEIRIRQNDEIGSLADAFVSMQDSLRAKLKMEAQLRQTDRLASLGILVSGIAHEINNPNGLIQLNAPLLKRMWESILPVLEKHYQEQGDFIIGGLEYSNARKQVSEMIIELEGASKRISHIVDDLKHFSRRDRDDVFTDVDINSVTESAIRLMTNKIKKSTNRFQVEYGEDIPPIAGHPQHIEQVIVNLLINATQALTDVNQAITVQTARDDLAQEILLTIRDEGVGIEESAMQHIFDPFFTTKRESGGTGLGLFVSMGIVSKHGGRMQFQSLPGKGTAVTLSLPYQTNRKDVNDVQQ